MDRLETLNRNKKAGSQATKVAPLQYSNSVDIWALGKILMYFLNDVPSRTVIRGKMMQIKKGPPDHLIGNMMQEIPTERPTASQCLEDPWMVPDDYYSLPVTKRDISPTAGQCPTTPPKKVKEEAVRKGVSQLHNTTAQYSAEDSMVRGNRDAGEKKSDAKVREATGLHDGELSREQVENTFSSTWGRDSEDSKPVTYPSEYNDDVPDLDLELPDQ
ncbi:MAG: hypothetical protein Q9217_004559 [Psora testacea]